jgi:membrane protein
MDKTTKSAVAEGYREALQFWAGLICVLAAMALARVFKADDSAASEDRAIPPIQTPLVEPGKRSQEHFENDQPVSEQERRAKESGRGRRANMPWHIPWNGWKDIFWRVYASINDNRLLAVAAGVTFYSVLAIFPAVAAFVSLYGLVADASTIDAHLSLVAGVLPGGALDILHEELTKLVAKSNAKLGLGFVFGLGVALWSANAGMKAIIDALNVVYDEKEKRSFIRLNLMSLLFTVLAILSLMVALGAVIVVPVVLSFAGLPGVSDLLISTLRWPLLLLLATLALAAIYRYGPSRREARWQWLTVGSGAAAVAWLLSSVLFSWYIASFGAYNATYGSLGAAVGMMMWMWISGIVILLGGELNAEIEHQTALDSTVGVDKPLGRRGAIMADTVGAARN